MEHIKLFEQFLNEGVSDIVYHYTSHNAFVNIVKEDAFYGTLAIGTDSDLKLNRGKTYFFSTTRSKSQGFNLGQVRFTIDGRKLSQKYKGISVDYWQHSKNPNDYGSFADFKQYSKDEMEDRILLDSPEIKTAGKYIKEVHMILNSERGQFDENEMKAINQWSDKYSIPITVYDEAELGYGQVEKAFKMEKGGIPIKEFNVKLIQRDDTFSNTGPQGRIIGQIIALLEPDDEKARERLINQLDLSYIDIEKADIGISNKEYRQEIIDKLKKFVDYEIRDNVRLIKRGDVNVIPDWAQSVRSNLHNDRTNRERNIRKFIKMLTQDMRRYKTNDIAKYIEKKLT